jgi:hypothetical protein
MDSADPQALNQDQPLQETSKSEPLVDTNKPGPENGKTSEDQESEIVTHKIPPNQTLDPPHDESIAIAPEPIDQAGLLASLPKSSPKDHLDPASTPPEQPQTQNQPEPKVIKPLPIQKPATSQPKPAPFIPPTKPNQVGV